MPKLDASNLHGFLETGSMSGRLSGGGAMSGGLNVPRVVSIPDKNYENMINKPQINGVELSGNKSSSALHIVSENTTEGWNRNPGYLPKKGEIVVYTDYIVRQDDLGRDITYPGIKIGDGNAYLIDLPFVNDAMRYEVLQILEGHVNNHIIHVSQEDRDFWNNKLNYDLDGEELVLTRL